MTKGMYFYRCHVKEAIPLLREEGLCSYLPNDTELGRKYHIFYPNGCWWDQQGSMPVYRLYFYESLRPCNRNRVQLRVQVTEEEKFKARSVVENFSLLEDCFWETGMERKRLFAPERLQIFDGVAWIAFPLWERRGKFSAVPSILLGE